MNTRLDIRRADMGGQATGQATSACPRHPTRQGDRYQASDAMSRYASGDDEAFASLYPALAPLLLRYLLKQTKDSYRADDLLQQTMLRIHCARSTFTPGTDVVRWAFSIARRSFIDSVRRLRHESRKRAAIAAETAPAGATGDDVVDAVRSLRTLERELGRLPARQRAAFELVRAEGLSVRDAARELGTSVNAVKLRTHRAVRALRAAIGHANGTGHGPWNPA